MTNSVFREENERKEANENGEGDGGGEEINTREAGGRWKNIESRNCAKMKRLAAFLGEDQK